MNFDFLALSVYDIFHSLALVGFYKGFLSSFWQYNNANWFYDKV